MLAILAGILFNSQQSRDLRGELRELRNEFRDMRNELRSEMAGMRNDIHADLRILRDIAYEHHGRLKTLEKKDGTV